MRSRCSFAVAALAGLTACAPAGRRETVAPIVAGHRVLAAEAAKDPLPPPWHDPLFTGAEAVSHVLQRAQPDGPPRAGAPLVGRDLLLERRVLEEARRSGRRDLRTVYAFVTICRADAPVAACADAILDPERERAALDADALVLRSVEPRAAGERRRFAVDMLRMGEGPFRYDFRWDFTVERRDRVDGLVLLRYELETAGRQPEHVRLFRGAARLAPEGSGTVWTEILLVGSDLVAPFFLESKAQGAVRDILARRWRRLSAGG